MDVHLNAINGESHLIEEKLIIMKIKEFYTTKINHEIKNPLITLKSKLEQFQSAHYKFYSLILKENPELELENLKNYINLMINKIFNICDFLSKTDNIKVNNSKIYLKDCLENVFSTIKTDLKNENLQNINSQKAKTALISELRKKLSEMEEFHAKINEVKIECFAYKENILILNELSIQLNNEKETRQIELDEKKIRYDSMIANKIDEKYMTNIKEKKIKTLIDDMLKKSFPLKNKE